MTDSSILSNELNIIKHVKCFQELIDCKTEPCDNCINIIQIMLSRELFKSNKSAITIYNEIIEKTISSAWFDKINTKLSVKSSKEIRFNIIQDLITLSVIINNKVIITDVINEKTKNTIEINPVNNTQQLEFNNILKKIT